MKPFPEDTLCYLCVGCIRCEVETFEGVYRCEGFMNAEATLMMEGNNED